MAQETVRTSTTKKRMIRAAVTGAIAVAAVIGGTATAFAAPAAQYFGPSHYGSDEAAVYAAAEADFSKLRAQCTADGGVVSDQTVLEGGNTAGTSFKAVARVTCAPRHNPIP